MLQELKKAQHEAYQQQKFYNKHYGKIKKIPEEAREIIREGARQETMGVLCCLMATVLNNDYGFGAKRIDNVCEQILKQLESIQSKNLDASEIVGMCKKIGMDFKKFGYLLEE